MLARPGTSLHSRYSAAEMVGILRWPLTLLAALPEVAQRATACLQVSVSCLFNQLQNDGLAEGVKGDINFFPQ